MSVKEGEGEDLLSSYAGDMDPSLRRKRYMAISKNIFCFLAMTIYQFICNGSQPGIPIQGGNGKPPDTDVSVFYLIDAISSRK